MSSSESEKLSDSEEEEEDQHSRKRSRETIPIGKKKKKARRDDDRTVLNFFEDQAESDDEEDEEDEGYENTSEAREAKEAQKTLMDRERERERERRPGIHGDIDAADRRKDEEDVRRYAEELQARHKTSNNIWRGGDTDGGGGIASARALPDAMSDPSLFGVKVAPGTEHSLVIQLMHKFLHMKRRNEPCGVFSVSYTNAKQFIYVEARSKAAVLSFVEGMRDVFAFRPSGVVRVPLNEMTSTIAVTQRKEVVKINQWVRFKRGPYKGDLAVVDTVLQNGQRVVVKAVPRVSAQGRAKSTKRRPKAQMFYVPSNAGEKKTWKLRGDGVFMTFYNSNWYNDGFIFKDVNVGSLEISNVKPGIDELQLFNIDASEEGGILDQLASASGSTSNKMSASSFSIGDTILVIGGEMENTSGIVTGINEVEDQVQFRLIDEDLGIGDIWLPASEIGKFFNKGDRCKVISGRYSGETGIIVHTEELEEGGWVAILFTDLTSKEISVFMRDLSLSNEIAGGHDSLDGYELYDLVLLGANQVGVIVGVGREDLNILLQTGEVKRLGVQNIRGKRNHQSANQAALDKDDNNLQTRDAVTVVEGPMTGQSGSIRHMHRAFLFVHNSEQMTNAGMFVERARNVRISGSKGRKNASESLDNKGDSEQHAAAKRKSAAFNGRRRDDEHKGKTVRIRKGRFKGYEGMVIDSTDTTVKVELHARSKSINVPRDHVMVVGNDKGAINSQSTSHIGSGDMGTGATSLHGSRTPLHGSMTPLHGSMTPMYGSATPLHGSATPMHEGSSSNTPGNVWTPSNDAWNPMYPNTPAPKDDDASISTPGMDYDASSSFTPGITPSNLNIYTPNTPGAMLAVGTPGDMTPMDDGYTHSDIPSTPGLYDSGLGLNTAGLSSSVSSTFKQDNEAQDGGPTSKFRVGFYVITPGGDEGYIDSINGKQCKVSVTDGSFAEAQLDELSLSHPVKNDTVFILSGDHAGSTGQLTYIDGTDGIVKVDMDIRIMTMETLVKYHIN